MFTMLGIHSFNAWHDFSLEALISLTLIPLTKCLETEVNRKMLMAGLRLTNYRICGQLTGTFLPSSSCKQHHQNRISLMKSSVHRPSGMFVSGFSFDFFFDSFLSLFLPFLVKLYLTLLTHFIIAFVYFILFFQKFIYVTFSTDFTPSN